jgi:DNA-binding SARP family transcriptional activator
MERAVELRPFDESMRLQLIEALLAHGAHVQAARQLAHLPDPPALLEARVFKAQGRLIDALARLERAWHEHSDGANSDEIAAAIIELAEDVGQLETLERFVSALDVSHPRALARAAEACLVLGRFDDAMRLGAALLKRREFVPMGRGILLVAATMNGSFGVAQRAARQLITSERTIDRLSLADLWRRGMIGRLISKHMALDASARTNHHSVLLTMAQSAAALFREQLAEAEARGQAAEAAELMHQIRLCSGQGARPSEVVASEPAPALSDETPANEAPARRAA